MGKHKEITGEPLENLIHFFGSLEKNPEKIENLKNFLYFQLSLYLIKRSCNFHRQTPNGDEAVIKNPFFLYYLPDIDPQVQTSFVQDVVNTLLAMRLFWGNKVCMGGGE